jgi:tRNA dimethylallyltransferase
MKKIIVITGPTATGKTKLSIKLAKIFNGEIINADSTQIYKGLNIATAKIKEEEKENVKHHLFDIKSVDENYTVYNYQKDSRNKIDEIKRQNKTPILVGGTGLYIKACLYDYNFSEEDSGNLYEDENTEELYGRLLLIDGNTEIHKNNRKRIIRALNYFDSNNKSISENKGKDNLLYDVVFIGLKADRKILYEKINDRVDTMFKNGLLKEAKFLYESGIRSKAVMTPIGYKELFPYFEGNTTLEVAVELIKQRSRRYAKKQFTFFNNQMNITWFDTDYHNFNKTIDEVKKYIENIL